jgi:hypothetical protein
VFKIDIDISALEAALDQQVVRVKEELPLRIPEELLLWQMEDMNRKHPRVYEQEDSWFTLIYPRSRLSGRGPVRKKLPGRRKVIRPLPRAPGTRPILREQLFDKLVGRVIEMLQYTVVWK